MDFEKSHTFYNVHTEPFSNFYHNQFIVNNKVYPTAEHFYQSQKFSGTEQEEKIRNAKSIQACHNLGQQYNPQFDNSYWQSIREKVYQEAVYNKFSQNMDLRKKLLDTGQKMIINIDEDTFWGIRYDYNLEKFVGENKTGKILMKVRSALSEGKQQ